MTKETLEENKEINEIDPVIICGISLDQFNFSIQLSILFFGVFFFYMLYGILQEYLFTSYNGFKFGFFVALIQFIVYSLISGIQYGRTELNPKTKKITKNYIKKYLYISFLSVLSMSTGYEALSYLTYPTKILFKSSKLLGIMIIGVLFLKKRYKKYDYIASFSIVIGLYLIYYSSSKTPSTSNALYDFDIRGVLLMTISIIADSFVGNLQDELLHQENVSANEVIFFSHAIGVLYLLISSIIFGQFFSSIQLVAKYPLIVVNIITISLCGYLGVQCVHGLTKLFGILMTVTATSTRKVLSIILSFLIFPKPFGISYIFAVFFVFTGVFIRVSSKNMFNKK
eukprot:gene3914-7126_t